MPNARNVTVVSHIDCPGGGQVWIDGTTLYVAHMRATHPDRPVMTYDEFFRERQNARYGAGAGKCS